MERGMEVRVNFGGGERPRKEGDLNKEYGLSREKGRFRWRGRFE